MRQFYTRVPSLALVFGLSMLAQGVSAALQTTPYIALHTQPRYSGWVGKAIYGVVCKAADTPRASILSPNTSASDGTRV